MSELYFQRFSGDTDPLSDKMFQRADPALFRFLVTGRVPDEPRLETPQAIQVRSNAHYTPDERAYLLTDERRRLLASTGIEGQRLIKFMESGDPIDLGPEMNEILDAYDALHPPNTT